MFGIYVKLRGSVLATSNFVSFNLRLFDAWLKKFLNEDWQSKASGHVMRPNQWKYSVANLLASFVWESSNLLREPQAIPRVQHTPGIPFQPQMKGIPNHKLLGQGVWGMFQGYVGKFLEISNFP